MMIILRWTVWLALYAAATAIQGADSNAVIKHKLMDENSHHDDASVVVTRVNNEPVTDNVNQTDAPAGEQSLEVECVVRLFVGMGTVDFSKLTRMAVKLEAGRTYQLGTKLTTQGDCTPTIQ